MGSIKALNRRSTWDVLRAFCLMETSCFLELTVWWKCHVLRNTTSHGNAMCGKKYIHEGFQQVTCEVRRGVTRGYAVKMKF